MKQFTIDAAAWGVGLWLAGYLLGFVLFAFVPVPLIGWVIMPVGTLFALWVLFKKIHGGSLQYYAAVGVVWVLIASICDYLFLVVLLKPADGYYKVDVYVYYALTLLLPIAVGWWKLQKQTPPSSTGVLH